VPKFCEEMSQSVFFVSVATVDDTHKLWRNIEPHFRKCLNSVYLREVSGFVVYCTVLLECNTFMIKPVMFHAVIS